MEPIRNHSENKQTIWCTEKRKWLRCDWTSFVSDFSRVWHEFLDQSQCELKQNQCIPAFLSVLNWKLLFGMQFFYFTREDCAERLNIYIYQPRYQGQGFSCSHSIDSENEITIPGNILTIPAFLEPRKSSVTNYISRSSLTWVSRAEIIPFPPKCLKNIRATRTWNLICVTAFEYKSAWQVLSM